MTKKSSLSTADYYLEGNATGEDMEQQIGLIGSRMLGRSPMFKIFALCQKTFYTYG